MSSYLKNTRTFAITILVFFMSFSAPGFAIDDYDLNMAEVDQMVAAINESALPQEIKNQLLRDMDVIRIEYQGVPNTVKSETLVRN